MYNNIQNMSVALVKYTSEQNYIILLNILISNGIVIE